MEHGVQVHGVDLGFESEECSGREEIRARCGAALGTFSSPASSTGALCGRRIIFSFDFHETTVCGFLEVATSYAVGSWEEKGESLLWRAQQKTTVVISWWLWVLCTRSLLICVFCNKIGVPSV